MRPEFDNIKSSPRIPQPYAYAQKMHPHQTTEGVATKSSPLNEVTDANQKEIETYAELIKLLEEELSPILTAEEPQQDRPPMPMLNLTRLHSCLLGQRNQLSDNNDNLRNLIQRISL
jgi:hypothetical protein